MYIRNFLWRKEHNNHSVGTAVQVWDVAVAVDRPRLVHNILGRTAVTAILLAPLLPLLIVGQSDGLVTVLQRHGLDAKKSESPEHQIKALAAALRTNTDALQDGNVS
jgi:hypothetical protein